MNNRKLENEVSKDEISLIRYVNILIKRKNVIIVAFFLSVFVAFVVYIKSPAVFEENTVIKIGSFSKPIMNVSYAMWTIRNQRTLTDAIEKYKLNIDINGLKMMFDANTIKITSLDPQFLKITVETNSPEASRSISKALAGAFVEKGNQLFFKKKQFLEAQLKVYQDNKFFRNNPFVYQSSISNLLSINEDLLNAEQFEITEFPSSSNKPVNPKKSCKVTFFPVIGLLIGVVLVFSQEFWANNIKKHD